MCPRASKSLLVAYKTIFILYYSTISDSHWLKFIVNCMHAFLILEFRIPGVTQIMHCLM